MIMHRLRLCSAHDAACLHLMTLQALQRPLYVELIAADLTKRRLEGMQVSHLLAGHLGHTGKPAAIVEQDEAWPHLPEAAAASWASLVPQEV